MAEKLRVFCTRDEYSALATWAGLRFGLPWTGEEVNTLRHLINDGRTLETICRSMERPAQGVLAKARSFYMIEREHMYGPYYVSPRLMSRSSSRTGRMTSTSPSFQELPKENSVSIEKNIETIVLIQGENAATKTDAQLYALIAKIEGQKKTLSAIENKPKKLEKTLKELQDDIDKIVKYVDERE